MRVEKDFAELLGLLNKHKVRYCIIGAFAVGFYGYPRYTKDMDILVEPTLGNGRKIIEVLVEFGFGSLKLTPEDFTKKGTIIQLGYEPVRVDLVTSIKGCDFRRTWQNRTKGKYADHRVFFLGLKDLIKNKRVAKRRQDIIDLGLLLRRLNKRKG